MLRESLLALLILTFQDLRLTRTLCAHRHEMNRLYKETMEKLPGSRIEPDSEGNGQIIAPPPHTLPTAPEYFSVRPQPIASFSPACVQG